MSFHRVCCCEPESYVVYTRCECSRADAPATICIPTSSAATVNFEYLGTAVCYEREGTLCVENNAGTPVTVVDCDDPDCFDDCIAPVPVSCPATPTYSVDWTIEVAWTLVTETGSACLTCIGSGATFTTDQAGAFTTTTSCSGDDVLTTSESNATQICLQSGTIFAYAFARHEVDWFYRCRDVAAGYPCPGWYLQIGVLLDVRAGTPDAGEPNGVAPIGSQAYGGSATIRLYRPGPPEMSPIGDYTVSNYEVLPDPADTFPCGNGVSGTYSRSAVIVSATASVS